MASTAWLPRKNLRTAGIFAQTRLSYVSRLSQDLSCMPNGTGTTQLVQAISRAPYAFFKCACTNW